MSEDVDPSLRVEADYDGPHVTIVVEGELDVSGATQLQACVSEALERLTWDRSITIDVRGLTYTDSSGLAGLLRARAASDEVAVAFRITEPSPALRRLIEMAGVANLLPDE
jgi:anti-anti-sigma factor